MTRNPEGPPSRAANAQSPVRRTAFARRASLTASAIAMTLACIGAPAHAAPGDAAHVYSPHLRPVSHISDTRMRIDTPGGPAEFALYVSRDWDRPQPAVTRAIIVIHGKLRNADTYFHSAETARDAAAAEGANTDADTGVDSGVDTSGTLLIAPQFLATLDFAGRDEPADLLRWDANGWMAGDAAVAPQAVSSYAVLDAIVARLADRTRFPNLRHVIFAGHSGGGQVVQRYAVAARDLGALAQAGIDVRYVVSSPSSYAYFDAERPESVDAQACPDFDTWKYGMQQRPAYLADRTPAQLEAAYARRRVTYLVGGNDDDPQQKALDRSCPAEAQGPQRVARAQAYFRYLQARHPQGLDQTLHVVPGVGHNGARMLTSACALAAMFDTAGCAP
ncbi:pimeloyl-ACP methyl ester carboxylesterase [Paraburkholderia tropica]|uniref:alpha/beta hydrolase n=1 Tax=Paraburkholderia tropica TaxID=92647 RepID=UPI001828F479|nr:alpha/beta hydrolase [Paraburkholderia tropica]MBB3001241.1 pimeloyl-ACP methyl ester carboxylesterase [Paraburkholderia tropica]MBB6320873.1 pimeloyl-ACP methyl ester carboxylesterase [Paraburkholderia tropica]